MRITFVLNHVNLNGGIRVIAIFAERLKARGHTVTVVARPRPVASLTNKLKSAIKGKGWPIDPNTLVTNAIWQRPVESLAATAGMHRFVWDFRPTPPAAGRGGRGGGGGGGGGRGGPPPSAPGTYSVRLTVNGKPYTQPLTIKKDPRAR